MPGYGLWSHTFGSPWYWADKTKKAVQGAGSFGQTAAYSLLLNKLMGEMKNYFTELKPPYQPISGASSAIRPMYGRRKRFVPYGQYLARKRFAARRSYGSKRTYAPYKSAYKRRSGYYGRRSAYRRYSNYRPNVKKELLSYLSRI